MARNDADAEPITALRLVWHLAATEAHKGDFSQILPEHFFQALLLFSEFQEEDLRRFHHTPALLQEWLEEIASLKQAFLRCRFDVVSVRRRLRALLGPGDGTPKDGVLHRSPEVKLVFQKAVELRELELEHYNQKGPVILTPTLLAKFWLEFPTDAMAKALGLIPDPPKTVEEVTTNVRELRQLLGENILGQDHAIAVFAEGFFTAEMDTTMHRRPRRSPATFVFAGPPGVGKTFMAKMGSLAIHRPFKRFDMSAYSDSQASDTLVGIPRSYKNASPGLLTEFVDRNPDCILLFDEIEKAHPNALLLFLQILDTGMIEDRFFGSGVYFWDTIIIFTTNAGATLYDKTREAPVPPVFSRRAILDALATEINPATNRPFFPPALCSRLAMGCPVLFNHLTLAVRHQLVLNAMSRPTEQLSIVLSKDIAIDPRVPWCLLLQQGVTTDARSLVARSAAFVQGCLYPLTELLSPDDLAANLATIKAVSINLDQDSLEANPVIEAIFHLPDKPKILLLAPGTKQPTPARETDPIAVFPAATLEEACQVLATVPVDFILADPAFGQPDSSPSMTVRQFDVIPLGTASIQNLRNALLTFRERVPTIPVVLLAEGENADPDQNRFRPLVQAGLVRKALPPVVPDGSRHQTANFSLTQDSRLLDLAVQYHREQAVDRLARERRLLAFDTVPLFDKEAGELRLRLRNFRLERAPDVGDMTAVLNDAEKPQTTFDQVIGAQSAKEELRFFIDYLKQPRRYASHGLRPPKGVLLYGPPGTGKTMLARAVAGESGVAFLNAPATNFVTIWQGSGPQNIRDLFDRARRYAPSIIFIDEIDAIGMPRTGGPGGGRAEETTLNALLMEMDGFAGQPPDRPVLVIAATNFQVRTQEEQPHGKPGRSLDPALLRRFSRLALVDLPDAAARETFFLTRTTRFSWETPAPEMMHLLVDRTAGLGIGDLENVLDTAIRVSLEKQQPITVELILDTLDTRLEGDRRPWSKELLRSTAYHEAGHTVMYWLSGWISPEVSIISRGDYGGAMRRCEKERTRESLTKEDLLAEIRTCLGGRAAEIILSGGASGLTTGASQDLLTATGIAQKLLCRFGMDADLGPLTILENSPFLSDAMKDRIQTKASQILKEQQELAQQLLTANMAVLEKIAGALAERNRLFKADLETFLSKSTSRPMTE